MSCVDNVAFGKANELGQPNIVTALESSLVASVDILLFNVFDATERRCLLAFVLSTASAICTANVKVLESFGVLINELLQAILTFIGSFSKIWLWELVP